MASSSSSNAGHALDGLPLPEHLDGLLPVDGGLRAFVDRGVERAVRDNGAYLEFLTWRGPEGGWTEDFPASWGPGGGNPRGWDDEAMALYERACVAIMK